MASKQKESERRQHQRLRIKGGVVVLGSESNQKCVVQDISLGGLSFRYYQGTDLVKQLGDDQSNRMDLFVEKQDLHLRQIPFEAVYDTEIDSHMPLNTLTIRKRGVRFGKLTPVQKSLLESLVQLRNEA